MILLRRAAKPRAATEKEIQGGEAAPNPTKGYCQLNPSTG